MMLRAARKLTGMARMMPKRVAIMPMKMVSTMRCTTRRSGSLARAGAKPRVWRASILCGVSLPSTAGPHGVGHHHVDREGTRGVRLDHDVRAALAQLEAVAQGIRPPDAGLHAGREAGARQVHHRAGDEVVVVVQLGEVARGRVGDEVRLALHEGIGGRTRPSTFGTLMFAPAMSCRGSRTTAAFHGHRVCPSGCMAWGKSVIRRAGAISLICQPSAKNVKRIRPNSRGPPRFCFARCAASHAPASQTSTTQASR